MSRDASTDTVPQPTRAVLGNAADGGWPARLRKARIDVLSLSANEAQRTRLRKRTAGGTDVAIALERGARLRDGDVLRWDDVSHMAVIVRVDLPDVMIIDFGALLDGPPETLLARSAEVGHALGNQHWPAVVKGTRMYVPVTLARNVMATVVRTHDIEGVGCSFAPGAEVLRQLAPQEAGLLFGGPAGHSHLPAGVASEETR